MLTKRTGLTWPWHPLQWASWLLGLIQAGIAYGVLTLELEDVIEALSFIFLFSLLFGATCGLAVLTMLLDPTDPVVYKHQDAMSKGYHFDENAYDFICTSCQSNVSRASKHCAQCSRCVAHFDHHCKWLNTCIGGRNYRCFAALLGVLEATELVLIVFGTRAITRRVNVSAEALEIVKLALLVTMTGLACILAAVTLHLILFHVWLRCKGWTTYDYIKSRRQRIKAARTNLVAVISTCNPQVPRVPIQAEVSQEDSYSHSEVSPANESIS